jgi:hypothetical protein
LFSAYRWNSKTCLLAKIEGFRKKKKKKEETKKQGKLST